MSHFASVRSVLLALPLVMGLAIFSGCDGGDEGGQVADFPTGNAPPPPSVAEDNKSSVPKNPVNPDSSSMPDTTQMSTQ